MMKTLFFLFFAMNANSIWASLDNCLMDAKTHGNHWHAVSPALDCVSLLRDHPERVEAKSQDGKIHVFGLEHIIVVKNEDRIEFLSGDQTELKKILKISINEKKRRIVVLQDGGILTFRLDFIGNVTPLRHFRSPLIKKNVIPKLLDEQDLLAIISPKSIYFVHSDSDSRYSGEKTKPRLMKEIKGMKTGLTSPTDVEIVEGEIKVSDSGRTLVFPYSASGDVPPVRVEN